jgi:hypothetical protein
VFCHPYRLLASPQTCFAAQSHRFLRRVSSCHGAGLGRRRGWERPAVDNKAVLPSRDSDSLTSHIGSKPWIQHNTLSTSDLQTVQCLVGVRRHKRNVLDPRKKIS